jgi:hypothetical protein
MKLQLSKVNKSSYSLRLFLTLAFSAILLGEAYLAYSYLYSNLFAGPRDFPEGNVVRVNLKAYEGTIEYLEGLYNYTPEPLSIPRNPFQ